MGKILSNDLMFADDICAFWPSVRGLQSILRCMSSLCRIAWKVFSTAAKLFVWRLRLRPQKARSSSCWHRVYEE